MANLRRAGSTPASRKRGSNEFAPSSDDALASEFAAKQVEYLRYDGAKRCWVRWNCRYWQAGADLEVFHDIRMACRAAASKCENRADAIRISSARKIASIELLSRSDPCLLVSPGSWDTDDFLFNTPEGIVDLRSGALAPHDPAFNITRIAPVTPGGDCVQWNRFLQVVTGGDAELQAFLQRMTGYFLTGSVKEQALFLLFGSGANGKSVFTRVLASAFGPYATTAPMDAFVAAGHGRHPADLAALQSARLVIASEIERNSHWAEARVKAITGGEDIAARFMNQNFAVHRPHYKIMITGNALPRLATVDEAMRRRVRVIPFSVTIPAPERDPDLTEKLLVELPGILQWAVEGCVSWQKLGLAPPPAVVTATDAYIYSEDELGRFIAECCKEGPTLRAGSTPLFQAYQRWSKNDGGSPKSHHAFTRELRSRGYIPGRSASSRFIDGLDIKEQSESGSPRP